MPTRRPSPVSSRAVVKKSTPVGCDCALVLPTASGPTTGVIVLGPVVRTGG